MRPVLPILLMLLAISPCHAWEIAHFKDRMTDRLETVASVRSNGAELVVGCMNGTTVVNGIKCASMGATL